MGGKTDVENAVELGETRKSRVLAVDDDKTSLLILSDLIEHLGYEVLEAHHGREALAIVEREASNLDVIVLDKTMPEMDGVEVVAKLKRDPNARHIPIVMVTGSTQPEEIKEGIDAGVFYYLTKPYESNVFESIVAAAMREAVQRKFLRNELRKHQTSFHFIDNVQFTIHKLEEAENLACFIANCFPAPDMALPGLVHLLFNAVEHGNLDMGYSLKTDLMNDGGWFKEIERREDLPEYVDREVKVSLTREEDYIRVRIEDEGDGFDWTQYLEIDPARALDPHGRGIAQANKISFDELQYNDKGNIVTVISKIGSRINW